MFGSSTLLTKKFPAVGLLFALMAGAFLLLLPFQVWQGLFSATQTAKVLFLGWSVLVFGTIGGIYYFFTGRLRKITFTATDISLSLLLIYAVVHIVVIRPVQLLPLFVLQWFSLSTLYIVFRRIEPRYRLLLILFAMVAAIAQAIYGNLQLYGIYPSYHNLFKLTGSFFNPGPYSGYLISALPVAVGLYFAKSLNVRGTNCLNARWLDCLTVKKSERLIVGLFEHLKRKASNLFSNFQLAQPSNRKASNSSNFSNGDAFKLSNIEASNPSIGISIIRIITIITIISIVLVLPAGRSRAAWLAAVISGIYLYAAMGKISELWHQFIGTSRRKWLLYTLIAISIIAITSGLYLMKKNSADGRVLIWKVTFSAIKEQPLWGHGIEKFKAFYMNGQAGYFNGHPDSHETAVAGDNNYAFNEPLRIASETGLLGLVIVLLVIYSAFRKGKDDNCKEEPYNLILLSKAGLLSGLIFGCFSYPAEIVPIMVNGVLYLAFIAGSQKPISTVSFLTKLRNPMIRLPFAACLISFALLAGMQLIRTNEVYTKWNRAYTTYSIGAYEDAVGEYKIIYPQLKNSGEYLINYGKALSMAGAHEKAIVILKRSKSFLNNTILYTALGDSYKATGQYDKAETSYIHAWQMVPSRFYPKYLLAKLYDETGQHEKAVAMAKELLRKAIKIESTAIKEIQDEMRTIIEKQENTQDIFNPKGKGRKHNTQVANTSCPAPFLKKESEVM